MARSWRIEYEGAFYHVFSRGNNQQNIFVTNDDRYLFLETLGQMSKRFDNDIFAYVLMSNHYHLLLRTRKANLSRSVQRLIDYRWCSYPAYAYNRRHPNWLDKNLIRSQIHGENKHRQYREKSQKYSDENRRIWEDIRHGFIYGSQKFVKRTKERYIIGEPDPAIP